MGNETKHTPGPWHFDENTLKVWSADDVSICLPSYRSDAERDANARLIAAAPETAAERDRLREINAELLKALKTLAGEEHRDDGDVILERARVQAQAAIAKAENR